MTVITTQPQELVAAGLTLYIAPVGSVLPLLDVTPTTPWALAGVNGQNDYDSSGLTLTHSQTIATWQPVGTTAPVAAWRTGEQATLSVTIADTSAPTYAIALNDVAVTTVSATTGNPGESDVPLLQGTTVNLFALLARGPSALNQSLNAQYWLPACYQSANPAPVYKLGSPAELALTFATILDPNGNGFGKLQQQSAART